MHRHTQVNGVILKTTQSLCCFWSKEAAKQFSTSLVCLTSAKHLKVDVRIGAFPDKCLQVYLHGTISLCLVLLVKLQWSCLVALSNRRSAGITVLSLSCGRDVAISYLVIPMGDGENYGGVTQNISATEKG